jgi:hypothetical protein
VSDGVSDRVAVADLEILPEIVSERVIEGDTELVARTVRVTEWVAACVPEIEVERDIERLSDLLGEKLEVWVGEIEEE